MGELRPVEGRIRLQLLHVLQHPDRVLLAVGVIGDVGAAEVDAKDHHGGGQLQGHDSQKGLGSEAVPVRFFAGQRDDLNRRSVLFFDYDLSGALLRQQESAVQGAEAQVVNQKYRI